MSSSVQPISVVIIEDHKLIAEAWKSMLELHDKYQVMGVFHNPIEGAEQVKLLRPQVLLVDINMQPISGVEVTKLVRKYSPGTRIIAVSLLTQPAIVKKIFKAGAMGYLTKSSDKKELYEAITEVLNGKLFVCGEIKNILTQINLTNEEDNKKPDLNKLSERELDIVRLLRKGYSSKDIAEELSLSVRTIDAHRYNILKKLNLKNVTALVNLVNDEGILY